jgi:hypothetical protein
MKGQPEGLPIRGIIRLTIYPIFSLAEIDDRWYEWRPIFIDRTVGFLEKRDRRSKK